MEGKFIKPVHLVVFGMFIMTLAGFFTVMHVGASARRAERIQHGFAFRGAPGPEKSSFTGDFKRGGAIVAAQARNFAGGLFSASGNKPPARGAYTASTKRASIYDEERNGEPGGADPFVEFYEQNYGRGAGASYSAPAAPWGGSASSWRGSGGSSTAGRGDDSPVDRAEAGSPAATAAEPEEEVSEAAETPGAPVFGGPLGKGDSPRQLQASLPPGAGPWQGLERPGELSGGGLAPSGVKGGKSGTLSGLPGRRDPGALDGAGESARSGSQGSYNSKMSGGAAAAAAAAPGAVPEAAKPTEVSADAGGSGSGGGSGGDSGSGSGQAAEQSGEKTADKPEGKPETAQPKAEEYNGGAGFYAAPAEDLAFLKTVALERSKGAEVKYVTEEDAAGELDEALLKSGAAVTEAPAEKNFPGARSAPDRSKAKADPEKFSALSAERKKELKREIHVFLRRIERRYGALDDIVYTSCGAGRELCAEHGLTEGYITMKTREGAKLLLGLKYVDKKWRPYTVGFTLPAARRPQPPPVEEAEQREEETPEGADPEADAESEE
ncbi:MAG: hypothetical protein AB7V08_06025 [Elusimicrobiales bacterium]